MGDMKPAVTTKRLAEIEKIQESIRKLADDYKKDFIEPNPMDLVVQQDLKTAADSLDLLKRLYKAKTAKG